MATLWLVGMMGAGKSTVGRSVADTLGLPFTDTDTELGRVRAVADWLMEDPAGFRRAEAEVVASLAGRQAVIACGGGVVLDPGSVERMRASGLVVWLEAPVEVLAGRVGDAASRPLLGDDATAALHRVLAERAGAYAGAAHSVVDAGRSVAEVAESVVRAWMNWS